MKSFLKILIPVFILYSGIAGCRTDEQKTIDNAIFAHDNFVTKRAPSIEKELKKVGDTVYICNDSFFTNRKNRYEPVSGVLDIEDLLKGEPWNELVICNASGKKDTLSIVDYFDNRGNLHTIPLTQDGLYYPLGKGHIGGKAYNILKRKRHNNYNIPEV